PYVVGGHTASGYWVDTRRETMIHGLFAAGDVAGGCPQKYVTGALAEGKIAAESIADYITQKVATGNVTDDAFRKKSAAGNVTGCVSEKGNAEENFADTDLKKTETEDFARHTSRKNNKIENIAGEVAEKAESGPDEKLQLRIREILDVYENTLSGANTIYSAENLEERMQKIMDEYAGGISSRYGYTERQLRLADAEIDRLTAQAKYLKAGNMHELLFVYELKDRLMVCKTLIFHLLNRKETRWHVFGENLDYPETDQKYFAYLNSRYRVGKHEAVWRDIVKENVYRYPELKESAERGECE
ncbi:MAG: hypothetical protein LIO75_05645, partial [Lachnospiraceae bacterium]|nr:hypothetical protein [Lachnospiraceae bacterium]